MGALESRKAAAKELQRMASLDERLDWRIGSLRLERERVVQLGFDLPCADLAEAVDHIDSAILLVAAARRHLEHP